MTATKPIGEVLNGIEIKPLDEGDVALETFLMVKVMCADGSVAWVERSTPGPHQFEFLGALVASTARVKRSCLENWIPDDPDEED